MEQKNQPLVTIVMGSTSDEEKVLPAIKYLQELEVPFEIRVASAHRTPHLVEEIVLEAQTTRVFIAAAGMAAALPGCIAALTRKPVIGLPLSSKYCLEDSILAMLQMPPGVPVLTVGVDAAKNAAVAACQILALSDHELDAKLTKQSAVMANKVVDADAAIREKYS